MRLDLGSWKQGSGPEVARLYHRLLALLFLDAWISLGVQVRGLIGERGLLPWADLLAQLEGHHVAFHELPSWLWLASSDRAILAGVFVGIALAVLALAGIAPRICFLISTFLYLGYAVAGRTFLSFQWDNLILECGLVAALLPRSRRAPLVHLVFRLILFKLYFESGIAKWQGEILPGVHDWRDGSAMTFYYETAPLPTWLALYFHALPVWWHHLEAWTTLFLELLLPFAIFGPRRLRLLAFGAFTGFQLLDIATANYGFFCYLALALEVFLLDDTDVVRAREWLWRRFRRPPPGPRAEVALSPRWRPLARAGAITFLVVFSFLSLLDGWSEFGASDDFLAETEPLRALYQPFRLVNTYHLFGSITRDRIEPTFELEGGTGWTEEELRHKPGDLSRRPDFVAPHQPRLDFQLWFYGLGYRRGTPSYVVNLLDRLCNDPAAVQPFFASPLPVHPTAVRMVFWRYHFVTPSEHWKTGAWWRRTREDETRPIPCSPQAASVYDGRGADGG